MTAALAALGRPVLTLNKNWTPVTVTTVKEAIGLVAKGSARILDPETFQAHDLLSWDDVSRSRGKFDGAVIRSSRLVLVPPEVILLSRYDSLGQRSVVFSRRNIFKRDRYTCQYCGKQCRSERAMGDLTIDHVVPRSRGGRSTWENCVLACVECNKRKADRTVEESGLRLRRQPKKPRWTAISCVTRGGLPRSWEQFISEAYWEVGLES